MSNLSLIKPSAPILSFPLKSKCALDDPSYKYVKADFSDIRVRFDAIRAAMKQEKKVSKK
jgi:hypothetical protein